MARAWNDPTNRQALETVGRSSATGPGKISTENFWGENGSTSSSPESSYRYVTGVNDFANVLHFDERDILSNTHEVEYGFVTRLYAKHANVVRSKNARRP